LGFTVLCDAISAATEFMVRALYSRMLMGFMILLGLKPGRTCGPIACPLLIVQ
jgi:hypothetical protein